MTVLASHEESAAKAAEKQELRLLLMLELRPLSNNTDLATLRRSRDAHGASGHTGRAESARIKLQEEMAELGKPGEFKTVPFTITNVEGMGSVAYGTTSYIVTSSEVKMEHRSVFGQGMSGMMTISGQ